MANIKKIKIGNTSYDLKDDVSGYITGITSSDVTTALGYTPYNSTNPSGYITGIDSTDIEDALGYTPANVFFATYGTTTFSEITSALSSGATVFVLKDSAMYYLAGRTSYVYYFSTAGNFSVNGSQIISIRCLSDNSWETQTSTLANTNLSNLTATGKETVTSYAFPSSTKQTLTKPASGGTVTAPDDGWIVFVNRVTTAGHLVSLSSTSGLAVDAFANAANNLLRLTLPVSKGDIVVVEYQSTSTAGTNLNRLEFVKAKGIA